MPPFTNASTITNNFSGISITSHFQLMLALATNTDGVYAINLSNY